MGDAQPGVVDGVVAHAAEHRHAVPLERGAVDPAGGAAEARAVLAALALQQVDLSRRLPPRPRRRLRTARARTTRTTRTTRATRTTRTTRAARAARARGGGGGVGQQPAARRVGGVDAVFAQEGGDARHGVRCVFGERRRVGLVGEELGDIEADAAGADDGHRAPHLDWG